MKLNKIIAFFAAAALVTAMQSCSDEDAAAPLASDGEVENSGTSYDSLSFEWSKISGATQYGYELLDDQEQVVYRDVTGVTNASFSALKPATEYTLKVWGYPAIGSGYVQSEPIVLKATTDPLKPIGQPTLTHTQKEVSSVVTWKKVTGATSYEYTLVNAAGEEITTGTTTSRTATFIHLDNGDYTVSVRALSTTPGYESQGEATEMTFTSNIVELWRAQGTYTSAVLGKSWDATIVSYGGGHYTILDWYGVNGYNFDFYTDDADPENIFHVYSYYTYDSETGNYAIPTGRADLGALSIYPWYNYSSVEGTKYKGQAEFYMYLNNDYVSDTYAWKGEYDGIAADNFTGTWNAAISGFSWLSKTGKFLDDGDDFDETVTVEITKIDNNTISMPVPYYSSVSMTVKIDMIDGVLTADPVSPVFKWYTFADGDDENGKIIGKINDDGSFEFNSWALWFDGDPYTYYSAAKYTR